jgi:hypothetical protein
MRLPHNKTMSLNRIVLFNYINKQYLWRKIHNYATIYELENRKNIGNTTKVQVRLITYICFLNNTS